VNAPEKICMFCPHFDWNDISYYEYSEYTVGVDGGATCKKGHFREENPSDLDDFRELILRAETCKDYSPPE
jgi:hypothetical protein